MREVNHVYFDLETERSAEEVGGWRNIEQMGMAVGVTCARRDDNVCIPVFKVFLRDQIDALLQELREADCVVGFNTRGLIFACCNPSPILM
jgi:DEAD/DEAH box helicase domain-containing protein